MTNFALSYYGFYNVLVESPRSGFRDFVMKDFYFLKPESFALADLILKFQGRDLGNWNAISTYAGTSNGYCFLRDGENRKFVFPTYNDNIAYVDPEINVSDQYLYGVLEFLVKRKLLEQNVMFVHGSAVSYKDVGFFFPAFSHTGKTNIVLQFLELGAKYMSDDYTILTEDRMYAYPRTLNLFDYNFKSLPSFKERFNREIINHTGGQQLSNMIRDKLYRKQPFNFRLDYKSVFPESEVCISSNIDRVILLQKYSGDKVKIESIFTSNLVNKIVNMLKFERREYDYWSLMFGFGNGSLSFMSDFECYIEKEKNLLNKIFEKTDNYICYIPLSLENPDEILETVLSTI